MNSWCRNLELLIKSRTSLIWIRTKEEERLEKLVNFSCERINIKRFICWDCVSGLKGLINEEGKFSNNPIGVLNWLKDQNFSPHGPFLKGPKILKFLKTVQ